MQCPVPAPATSFGEGQKEAFRWQEFPDRIGRWFASLPAALSTMAQDPENWLVFFALLLSSLRLVQKLILVMCCLFAGAPVPPAAKNSQAANSQQQQLQRPRQPMQQQQQRWSRSPNSEGLLFALVMGPAVMAALSTQLQWLCRSDIEAIFVLGSVTLLVQQKARWSAPQLLSWIALSSFLLKLSVGSSFVLTATFLGMQVVFLGACRNSALWGQCFSIVEGTFWAQTSALVAAAFVQGWWHGFRGWQPVSIFAVTLVIFTVLFLAVTAIANLCLRISGTMRAEWAPIWGGLLTLVLFLLWMLTGVGGWAQQSADRIPLLWLVDFILYPAHAKYLVVRWPISLVVGIAVIHYLSGATAAPAGSPAAARRKVLYRKAFHALASSLFLPPLIDGEAACLGFCMLVASLLLLVLEACRAGRVPGLAPTLDRFVARYLDQREDTSRGDLVLTHLYLLLGCALPVWLAALESPDATKTPTCWSILRQSSGILLIGVGDACAAAFGVCFGSRRWPHSHRTLEGSFAFLLGIGMVVLCIKGFVEDDLTTRQWASFAVTTTLSMVLEVYTESIDNLVLPLYFFPVLHGLSS